MVAGLGLIGGMAWCDLFVCWFVDYVITLGLRVGGLMFLWLIGEFDVF